MELDQKAIDFIKRAKEAGKTKEDTQSFLASKGYEIGQPTQQPVQQPTQAIEPRRTDYENPNPQRDTRPFNEILKEELKKSALGSGRDVASYVPLAGGFADNIEAGVSGLGAGVAAAVSGKPILENIATGYKEALPEIRQEQREFGESVDEAGLKIPRFIGNVAGGIRASSGLLGGLDKVTKGNKLARFGIGAGLGAAEGAGFADKEAGTGALLGAIIGSAGSFIPSSVKVKAGRQAEKLLAKGKDFKDIVMNSKGTKALNNAIKADDRLAQQIGEKAGEELIQTAPRVDKIIKDTLGYDDIQTAKKQAYKGYEDILEANQNKTISSVNKETGEVKDIYNNDTLKQALSKARQEDLTGELTKLPDNSLAVAQKTKEVLDDLISGSKQASEFGKQRNTNLTRQYQTIKDNFVKSVDEAVPEYKQVREAYSEATKTSGLLDKLTDFRGSETSNISSGVLGNQNKALINKTYGTETADKLFKSLRNEQTLNKRLSKLSNAGEQKITKSDPTAGNKFREMFESLGSTAGNVIDLAGGKRGSRTRKELADVLLGNKEAKTSEALRNLIIQQTSRQGNK